MQEVTTETAQEWFKDWFSREEYKIVYNSRDEEDAVRLLDLIERSVGPGQGDHILDLACGRGRHAVNLARRGYRVTGLDLSLDVLKEAARRAKAADLDIRWIHGDMREPLEGTSFDGIVNLFTSFGYFNDDADHAKTIAAAAGMLDEGGWFFQDFLNVPYVVENLVPFDERSEDGITIMQRRWIESGRVNKEIMLQRSGDIHTFTESVRLLTLDDFSRWYRSAGLEVIDVYGSYDGDPLSESTPRLILYARKQ